MSDLELMLLITSYISVPYTPKINQDSFENLINAAKTYDYALENIWRIGMNFDCKGYNYNLLDEFFVNSKDIRYLGEYIHSVSQINQENIVNNIIRTADKDFIKQILKDKFILDNLEEKYKEILEENI